MLASADLTATQNYTSGLERTVATRLLLDNDGKAPLHITALHGHSGFVRFLLETGRVDLELVGRNSNTPLKYTIKFLDLGLTNQLSIASVSYKNQSNNSFTIAFYITPPPFGGMERNMAV
jgi:hypothetical protein